MIEDLWRAVAARYGFDDSQLLAVSRLDPGRRVYRRDDRIYKVVLTRCEKTSFFRNRSLREEYEVLRRLAGVAGVPQQAEYVEADEVAILSYRCMDGRRAADRRVGPVTLARVARLLWRLSARSVVHNDVTLDNVLIGADGGVGVIDFDQASYAAGPAAAIAGNFLGLNTVAKSHNAFPSLVPSALVQRLPPSARRRYRDLRDSEWGRSVRRWFKRIPAPPPGATEQQRALHRAWQMARDSDANAPGLLVSYYELDVDGYRLPGERAWGPRWELLSSATELAGKRVLETGCNLSLLSCQLLAYKGAAAACCVDVDADILAAAQKVAQAYGVRPWYRRVDFDADEDWESELAAFRPDVVFALSVLNWLRDKERFLRFLGRFPEVVFEGHESFEVEAGRLRRHGFASVSQLGVSERNRPVVIARK